MRLKMTDETIVKKTTGDKAKEEPKIVGQGVAGAIEIGKPAITTIQGEKGEGEKN